MTTAAHRLTIMKPGCYVAMGGERVCFDAAHLAQIAAAYTPALREAPLVIGHPANDGTSPAHGWITSLSTGHDGELIADLSHLSEEIKALTRAGKYRHLSASFMPPRHPANPRPEGWYLRHVGALGASGPAVPGLSTLAFAEACPLACPCPTDLAAPLSQADLHRQLSAEYWTLQRERQRRAHQPPRPSRDFAEPSPPDWHAWQRFMDAAKVEEDAARARQYAQMAPVTRKARIPSDPYDEAAWEAFNAEVNRELNAATGQRLAPATSKLPWHLLKGFELTP